jgi:F-type H+-transporting ATPase subunit alpha
MSQYNEVKAFAQFGTEGLDQATRDVLNHGEKLTELLKQNQFAPQSVGEQTVVLFSATKIDDIPTQDVQRFEAELLEYIRDGHPDIVQSVNESLDLSDEVKDKLDSAIDSFKAGFQVS